MCDLQTLQESLMHSGVRFPSEAGVKLIPLPQAEGTSEEQAPDGATSGSVKCGATPR